MRVSSTAYSAARTGQDIFVLGGWQAISCNLEWILQGTDRGWHGSRKLRVSIDGKHLQMAQVGQVVRNGPVQVVIVQSKLYQVGTACEFRINGTREVIMGEMEVFQIAATLVKLIWDWTGQGHVAEDKHLQILQ